MWAFDYLKESSLPAANKFPGFISILIYNPAAKIFERKIKDSYAELHVMSGKSLLIIAGESNWVSEKDRLEMQREVRRRFQPDDAIQMIVAMEPTTRISAAKRLKNLADRFGVQSNDLPCLVFLERLDSHEGFTCPINRDLANSTNDDLAYELAKMFDVCSKEAIKHPFPHSPYEVENSSEAFSDLIAWRRSSMLRIEPELRLSRWFSTIRKNTPNLISGASGLVGLL